ncbi:SDR family oxidoreductase [Escherichia coli]|uniref:SDR family oxidoreductase n=1 Tax=Escherichia coli TaxID=562 RepID=UPI0039775720
MGQQVENVYVESKFLAEKLVREAIAEGVSATVYRVGNLVGRTHFLLVAPGQNLALKTRMGQNHLDDVQQC